MKRIEKILPIIKDALAKEIPVYITDGTVTRAVVWVSYDRDFFNSYGFFHVSYEANGEWYVFSGIKTTMLDELIEWSVKQHDGFWYIAPDWWHGL